MKRLFFIPLLLIGALPLKAQSDKENQLQALEQNQPADQNVTATAKLKSASRLFATRDDLTSVIIIIPADSVVNILDSDSTYFHVFYNDTEGYIFKRDAVMDKLPPISAQPNIQAQPEVKENAPVREQPQDRISYLENKYGPDVAAKIIEGKIWKGMSADMVSDSWGTPVKINRIIDGNIVKEEWIFKNTWLHFENNTLLEWGPAKK
jgi:hypothetical protein